MPDQPTDTVDLSGYKVTLYENAMGRWAWEAKAPDGTTLTGPDGIGTTEIRLAEEDAFYWISHHHRKRETIDGETLRQRVAEREGTDG